MNQTSRASPLERRVNQSRPVAHLTLYLTPGLTPLLNLACHLLIVKSSSIVWWVAFWGLGTLLIGWASTTAKLPGANQTQTALWLLGLTMGLPLFFFFIVPTPIEGTGHADFRAAFAGLAFIVLGFIINLVGGLIAIGWGIWQISRNGGLNR